LQAHFAIDSNTKVFCKLSISQLKPKEVRLKSDNHQCCSIHFFPKEPPISIFDISQSFGRCFKRKFGPSFSNFETCDFNFDHLKKKFKNLWAWTKCMV
jgi:hypothetical protein